MSGISSFRDLLIWQRGKSLAVEIYSVTGSFPQSEIYGLTSQMRRSAVSIPSNIAEGFGKHSTANFVNFLRTSLGSLFELQTQLEIANEIGFLNKDSFNLLIEECAVIGKMINSLILKLNTNKLNEPEMEYNLDFNTSNH